MCARCQRTGAAARESPRRDRPVGLTSPAFHACGSASPFRAYIFTYKHAYIHTYMHACMHTLQCAQRTGAAARESIRRDRPGGLTSPAFHASRGNSSCNEYNNTNAPVPITMAIHRNAAKLFPYNCCRRVEGGKAVNENESKFPNTQTTGKSCVDK